MLQLFHGFGVAVTGGAIGTHRAGEGLYAFCFAGGSRGHFAIVVDMTHSGNNFFIAVTLHVSGTAVGASEGFDTVFGTGCGGRHFTSVVGMTGLGNHFGVSALTAGTGIGHDTGCHAGGRGGHSANKVADVLIGTFPTGICCSVCKGEEADGFKGSILYCNRIADDTVFIGKKAVFRTIIADFC